MMLHNKFIFTHLTKTGGTFIRQYLAKYIKTGSFIKECQNSRLRKHDPLCKIPELILNSRYKFGVVRNPLSFYVSLWGANITSRSIRNRPRRKIWFKNNPEMKEDPKKFIKFLCDEEKGKINFFDFDLIKKMDIGVLTYRYLYLYYDHKIFSDKKWIKNHKKYKLVDEVIRFEDGLASEIERVFHENIFNLNKTQKSALYNFPKKNKSKHRPFMEYYNKETINYVKYKDRFIFKIHY